jgi:polar amino acid transport system substrate-binding protein
MATIAARGRLIAGVDQGKYRVGYRNPITGGLEGSDIDVVRQIAAAIFGDPNRVQFVVLDIADRVGAIERGQVDLVVNNFTVTCERQRKVEFSTAYLAASQRVLVPTDSKVTEIGNLTGARVCTSSGSTTETVLRAMPGLDVVTLPGIPDCMVELQRGRVAAVSSDDVILAGLEAQDPQTKVVGQPLAHALYAIGMSPGTPDLVRFRQRRAGTRPVRRQPRGERSVLARQAQPGPAAGARPLPRLSATGRRCVRSRRERDGDRRPGA